MIRAGRWAGAIRVDADEAHYLVGNTKQPCDWVSHGFEPPVAIDAVARPVLRLARCGHAAPLSPPVLLLRGQADAVAEQLAQRLLIHRNGSVSERLWGLALGADPDTGETRATEVPAQWLLDLPAVVWDIVRDRVLRCL